jgi:hypothetical protein
VSGIEIDVDPKLIDVSFEFDGMLPDGYSESDLFAAGAEPFPDSMRVDRKYYDDAINKLVQTRSSAKNFVARLFHQGNSHECVSHASSQAVEIVWNRQLGGILRALYLSPLALYTRITGGRQWGGSNVMDALREMMSRGMIPEHDGPEWLGGKGGQVKHFKATVQQTSGRSEDHWPTKGFITPSKLPVDWQLTSRHVRVLKAYTIPDDNAHFSALFHTWPVVNGRSGHSICHCNPVKSSGRYLSEYADSYSVYRMDSEGMTGGGYCIVDVTTPDDPKRPAGADMKE